MKLKFGRFYLFIQGVFFLTLISAGTVSAATSDFCLLNPGTPEGGKWFYENAKLDSSKTYTQEELTNLFVNDKDKPQFLKGATSMYPGTCKDAQDNTIDTNKSCSVGFTHDFPDIGLSTDALCSSNCKVSKTTSCIPKDISCDTGVSCKITYKFTKKSGSGSGSDGSAPKPDDTKLFNPLEGIISSDKPVQTVAAKLINAMFGVAGSIALFMFVLGGFLWLLSRGESDMVTKGKNIFIWSSLGLTVMFSSYVIVNYIFKDVLGSTGVAGTGSTSKPGGGTGGAGTTATKPGCCLNLDNNTVTDVAAGANCPSKLLEGVACSDAKICFETGVASCTIFKKSDSCGNNTEYPTSALATCISDNAGQGSCCVERGAALVTPFSSIPKAGDANYEKYTNCKVKSPQSPKPFDGLVSTGLPKTESTALYSGSCSSGNICISSAGCDYAPGACPSGSSLQFAGGTSKNLSDCWVNYYSNNYPKASTPNAPYCLAKVRHSNGIIDPTCVAFPDKDTMVLASDNCLDDTLTFTEGGSTAANEDLCKAVLSGNNSQAYCLKAGTPYTCEKASGAELVGSACIISYKNGATAENESACKQQLTKVNSYLNSQAWCCVYGNTAKSEPSKEFTVNGQTNQTVDGACQTELASLNPIATPTTPWKVVDSFEGACQNKWWNISGLNTDGLKCVSDATYQFMKDVKKITSTATPPSFTNYKNCAQASGEWTLK